MSNIIPYFSHLQNARNTPEILRIRMKYGAEGYGIYFMILERLREDKEYMSVTDYNVIAFDIRVDASKVKAIVEDFGLFVFTEDGKYFYSEILNENMEIKDEIKRKKSEAGKKGAAKRWGNKNVTDAIAKDSTAITQPSKNIARKEKKSKEKKSKENNITTTPPLYKETGDLSRDGGGVKEDAIKKVIEIFNYSGFSNITPSTKDTLISFAKMYPIAWIEEAFKIASDGGKLNLNYVRGILNRWQTNGKDSFKKESEKAKKTKFHNFKQITDEYSAEDLEEMAMRKQKEGFEKLGVNVDV